MQLSSVDHKPANTFKVATINFCGVSNNPFEFYSQDFEAELARLSQIFLTTIPLYYPQFNKEGHQWKMGKLEHKIRNGRYSPLFDIKIGIEDNKFLNKQEFQKSWDQALKNCLEGTQLTFSEEDKSHTRTYDFITYHTLLQFVFGNKIKHSEQEKAQFFEDLIKNNPQDYIKVLKPFFQLSFLDEQKKLLIVLEGVEKIQADVFFFQESSTALENFFISQSDKYFVATDSTKDTLIVARKSAFNSEKKPCDILSQQWLKRLNWTNRSALLILDDYLFICAHLNSKKELSQQQIKQMTEDIIQLKAQRPQIDIVVAGDLNSFMSETNEIQHKIYIYPREEANFTTLKKRTMTQGQYKKGNVLVIESKDKIISNLEVVDGWIGYIDLSSASSQCYIPSNSHPFDHLLVTATIKKREDQKKQDKIEVRPEILKDVEIESIKEQPKQKLNEELKESPKEKIHKEQVVAQKDSQLSSQVQIIKSESENNEQREKQ